MTVFYLGLARSVGVLKRSEILHGGRAALGGLRDADGGCAEHGPRG